MRRRGWFDVVAVLAARGERLRERQEAAAAELAAERDAAARLEAERQRARDAAWAAESRAERDRQQKSEPAPVLTWPKGMAV